MAIYNILNRSFTIKCGKDSFSLSECLISGWEKLALPLVEVVTIVSFVYRYTSIQEQMLRVIKYFYFVSDLNFKAFQFQVHRVEIDGAVIGFE